MLDIKQIVAQHPTVVAQLFANYGIEVLPTEQNLSAAIVAYKRPFLVDLVHSVHQAEYVAYDEFEDEMEEFGKRKKKKGYQTSVPGHDVGKKRKHALTGEQKAGIAGNVIGGISSLATGISNAVAVAKGSGSSSDSDASDSGTPGEKLANPNSGTDAKTEEKPIKKYLPYIIGGVALLVVGVIAFIFLKKKK